MQVSLICATTLCGRICPAPLGSTLDRARLERARTNSKASLIGAGTLREGNPEMLGPGGALIPGRIRAIVTKSGNIPIEGKRLFEYGPPPIIFTGKEKTTGLQNRLLPHACCEVIGISRYRTGELALREILDVLEIRGADSVLIEGGGILNHAAISQGVVDELILTITPLVLGTRGIQSLADGDRPVGDPLAGFRLVSCKPQPTGEIFLRYIASDSSR